MSSLFTPDRLRLVLLSGIVNAHVYWTRLVNSIVPDPYLDEVFHIPQAQAYWAGNWTTWDPKITTPPATYIFSSLVTGAWKPFTRSFEQTTTDLRTVNFFSLYALLIGLYGLSTVVIRQPQGNDILPKEFVIIAFPLLVFFSSLYYTDVFSALTVVLTYLCWGCGTIDLASRRKWQILHVICGLVAIATRQTNIFWVAVFLGGLQVRETASRLAGRYRIFDPPVLGAYFEDLFTMSISVGFTAISDMGALLLDLWPQLVLLGSFATFVIWNGSVVLGDKTNHIATIHLPQLLYLWPFITFFSWPILLPHFFHLRILSAKFPRLFLVLMAMTIMALIVHFNTTVHPFTLADNRHYPFYIFRILLNTHPFTKYAVIPVYFICAWLCLTALGGTEPPGDEFKAISEGTVRVSFVAIWFLSTALSLATTPLVEPRYFIIPWLLWRLHVPSPQKLPAELKIQPKEKRLVKTQQSNTNAVVHNRQHGPTWLTTVLDFVSTHILWFELTWFGVVNVVTGWMFLYRGFAWEQEPGKVQRFMW